VKAPSVSELLARGRAMAVANPEGAGAIAIFALALALRLPLIGLGLPYAAHPDEAQLLHRGVEMLKTGNLNPEYFNYPSFPMYVHAVIAITSFLTLIGDAAIQSLAQLETMLDTGLKWQRLPEVFTLRGREFSCVLGALGITGGYLSVSRLFGTKVALVGGAIASLSLVHVNATRYIATDAFATCFTSFAVFGAIEIWRRGSLGDYAFAGAMAALSAASKYNAGAIVTVAIVAHFLRDEHKNGHVGPLALLLGTTGVTFLGANPYVLLDLPTFIEGLAGEIRHYSQGDAYGPANVAPGVRHVWRMFTFLTSTDGVGFWTVLALPAPFLGRSFGWKRWTLLLAYPVVAVALLAGQAVFFPRNLILLVPWIGACAAITLFAVIDAAPRFAKARARQAVWAVIAVFVLPGLPALAWIATESQKPESRTDVVDYARDQLPAGATVAVPAEMDLVLGDWAKDPMASKVITTRLADMSPGALVKEGATHVILSDKFGYTGGFGGLTQRKIELINEGSALLPSVFTTGGGYFSLGGNMLAPRLGVYRLDDAEAVAKADAKFTIPALDPVWGYVTNGGFEDELIGDVPPGFMLIPPGEAKGTVEEDPVRGTVFRIDASAAANPTMVCMSSEVALGGPVALSGWWKSENITPGARAQVRFWTSGPLATIREATTVSGTNAWQNFRGVVDVPEGVKRTKVCIFLQSEKGTLWLDDLSLAPAGAAELGTVAAAAAAPVASGPPLPGAWIAVPDSLAAEERAGPVGTDGFFVVGRPGGESLICDNTPRPVTKGEVKIHAKVSAEKVPPGTGPGLLPRIQVRGMLGQGGSAAKIDDTIVLTTDAAESLLTGTAVMPGNIAFWKVCVVVRTPGTKVTVTGFGEG
jgi:hypothetical protein